MIDFDSIEVFKVKLKDEKEKLIFILYKIHYYKDNLVIVSIGFYVVEQDKVKKIEIKRKNYPLVISLPLANCNPSLGGQKCHFSNFTTKP